MRTRSLIYLALSMVVVLLAVTCGSAEEATPTPTRPPAATPTATTPPTGPAATPTPTIPGAIVVATPTPTSFATPTPVTAVDQPKYGGILRYTTSPRTSFDCHAVTSSLCTVPAGNVFNFLVRFDPTKASTDPRNIQGDLAESWEFSADGKDITFYLREGVKFHNGAAFNADVAKNHMDILNDPEVSSIAAWWPGYESTEVVDENTIIVHLNAPMASFLIMLSAGVPYVYHTDVFNTTDGQSTDFLMGTGPFKFKSETPGVVLEYERNDNYFRSGLPYLDGVEIYHIPDRTALRAAFASKRLDMNTPAYGASTLLAFEEFQAMAPDALWQITPNGHINGMGFWGPLAADSPWQIKEVRQAFSLVMDRSQGLEAGWGTDWGRIGGAIWPGSAFALEEEEMLRLIGHDKPIEERVVEAKALMAAAGYPDGFEGGKVTTRSGRTHDTQPQIETLVDLVKRYLNVEITINPVTPALLMDQAIAGSFEYLHEWPSSMISDPNEVYARSLGGSPNNWSTYDNPVFNDLFIQQSEALDVVERIRLSREMERLLLDDVPWIYLGWARQASFYWDYVKGFTKSEAYVIHNHAELIWLDK